MARKASARANKIGKQGKGSDDRKFAKGKRAAKSNAGKIENPDGELGLEQKKKSRKKKQDVHQEVDDVSARNVGAYESEKKKTPPARVHSGPDESRLEKSLSLKKRATQPAPKKMGRKIKKVATPKVKAPSASAHVAQKEEGNRNEKETKQAVVEVGEGKKGEEVGEDQGGGPKKQETFQKSGASPAGRAPQRKGKEKKQEASSRTRAASPSEEAKPKKRGRANQQEEVPSASDGGKEKTKGSKKSDVGESALAADQVEQEPSNKRKKAATEAPSPRTPSKRPGLRSSAPTTSESEVEKVKSAGKKRGNELEVTEKETTAKRLKVSKKETKAGKEEMSKTKAKSKERKGKKNSKLKDEAEVASSEPEAESEEESQPTAKPVGKAHPEIGNALPRRSTRSKKSAAEGIQQGPISKSDDGFNRTDVGEDNEKAQKDSPGAEGEGIGLDAARVKHDDAKRDIVGGEAEVVTAEEGKPSSDEVISEKPGEFDRKVLINRAPVITLWVPVVAQREGYKFEEGLTFGRAISGMYAQAKGKRLGLIGDIAEGEEKRELRQRAKGDLEQVEVFGTRLRAKRMEDGQLLAVDQSGKHISPSSVLGYVKRAFGSDFEAVKGAMEKLASSLPQEEIGRAGYRLYEKFRPRVSEGVKGWGTKGILDLNNLVHLAEEQHTP